MKKYLVLMLFLFSGLSYGQVLARDSSYAANDTTVWASIDNGNKYLAFVAEDSCNVKIEIDYAESINSTTNYQSYTLEDSTNSVVATGFFKGYPLRVGTTNRIPGAGAVRLRITKIVGNGKNGTTSPNYSAYIRRY